ncbi:protein kinase, putative [Leishmania guyanensis]
MDPAGRSFSGEQQQQASEATGDAGRDTANAPLLQCAETSPFESESTKCSGLVSPPPLAPLSVVVRVVPTLAAATTSTASATFTAPVIVRSSHDLSSSSATPPVTETALISASASSNLRGGNDTDGGDANEGEEEPFLTNGSIALAEFTSLLNPTENNAILKEHIIHMLRDVDTEETLMRIAHALETQETSETPVDVSTTICTESSHDVESYTHASQSTVTSMSMTQGRRSSVLSRREATSLEGFAGLSFLRSRRRTTSPSAQDCPSLAQPLENRGLYNQSARGLGGPMDVSFSSHTSAGTREEELQMSKQHDNPPSAFMATSASQFSETTATLLDDPLLRELPELPTCIQSEGRRAAVSAAPYTSPFDIISGDAPATAPPPLRVVPKTAAEEQQLRRLLHRCHSFSSLEADTLEAVLKAMDKEIHAAGAAILEQGQPTTEKLYLVSEGTCEAIKNGKSLGPLQPGGTFGELELMYKQAMCAATIRCVTRCVLYTLDEASYHRAVMSSSLQKRRRFEKLTMSVPFLRGLPDFERMKIAEALETRVYKHGKTIIRFGSPGNYMHFIVEGEVKVIGRNSGRRVEVVRLRAGDVVGELEFLFNHLTVADVVATSREVRTACISREHFELIIGPIQDRLKEFVATSSTYEKYYVSEVANESVRSELNRIESSRKHRRVASHDEWTAIGVTNPHGEVLLSAPLALLHGKCGASNSDSTAKGGADAHGQRRQAAGDSDQLSMGLLRFPFAPVAGKDVAVLALREDGLIIYWNSVLERLMSYSADEVVGQNIYSFLLSEREQQSMYTAINAARNYAGEAEAFLKQPNTKSMQFTLARSDGLTKTTIQLTIAPPVVSAGGNAAEVVLGFGKEVREGPQKMLEQPQWLSGQIRTILADGTQTFEERLECIAETLNNFESTYRAMTVSTERLRVVNIRQMMGHVLMNFGGECVSRGISVRQLFEGLPSERAYLDADLLPKCLCYAMKLCLKYSDPGGSIVSIMTTVTEKNGLEFLVINFNLTGDGMPKAIAKFFDSSLNKHSDSCATLSLEVGEDGDSDDDGENYAEESTELRKTMRPGLRRKLLRVQRAVEDQGGTLRMLRNPQDSNIAFLIPFMPASEQDAENAFVEESLSTLADSTSASQSMSLAGMGNGIGPPTAAATATGAGGGHSATFLPGGYSKAAGSVSLAATPAGEASGLSNQSVPGAAVTVPGQPNFSYTTCLAEDTPAHRIMLSSFLWERHHAVLTAFTFEDVVGLAGVADILIIDLQQSAITSPHDLDPITRLREMLRHMAVIITATNFDLVSSDTYAAAGFITLKKPCTPVQAMKAIRHAEEKSAVVKLERMRIEQTRETLARNSRGAWRHGALLGKGSSGEVYEAYDVLTGGKMAVKEMRLGNNDAKIEQFVQEISTMCNLQHPNIIHYFYCEESKEQKVIRVFMEFAGGGTLQSLLKRKGKLQYVELRALLRDVVEGLAYIHSQHYVHGDIKTANVLLSSDGKGKIGDFGTARTVQDGELLYVMQGSPLYMSPECMSAGEEDEEGNRIGYGFPSDIWSLGCVAMEMATNKPPFAHIKSIKGPAGLTNFITSLTDVPDLSPLFKCHPSIVEFVSACLNPDPSQRASAQDLLQMSLFSESTHGDRNSAVKALKRAQLLHVLKKFVAFQEPQEADKLKKRRNRPKVRRLTSDFFSSNSSPSDTASSGSARRLTSTAPLKSALAAEVEGVAGETRCQGATAAVAEGNEDESETDVPRHSDKAALGASGTSQTPDGARAARASAEASSSNTVTAAGSSLNLTASTFRRYLRKWDFSSTSSSSSAESNRRPKAMAPAAGGDGGAQRTPQRHCDPVTGVAGQNDKAEPDARNPNAEVAYELSPTPKKRSKTRSRPQTQLPLPVRSSSHQQRDRGSTTTITTNSTEEAFFATSSNSRSSSRSSNSGRTPNKAGSRNEAVGYTPSFPGRRRNVMLDEAGNIVSFDQLRSMTSGATLPDSKGEQHGVGVSAGRGAGVAAAATAEVTAPPRTPLSTLGDVNDHALSPSNAMGLVNASFAQPPGNFSFFNYSFNKNISFLGANMDEVLNSAANDFLNHLAANSHTNNAACVETVSSAGSAGQPSSRTLLCGERSGSGRSHAVPSSTREGEGHTDCTVVVTSPLAGAAHSEDCSSVAETPSRQRGWTVSRSPSTRSPLGVCGQGEPALIEGGNGVQHSGATLPRPQTPPNLLSMAATPAAASRSLYPVSSQLGSASYTSDDGTASITPRGDSVPLVGAAAPPHRRRRVRPPITNQSFFVVEDRSSVPFYGGAQTTSTLATPSNISSARMPGFSAGSPFSPAQISLTTLSSVASADGSITGGMAGDTNNSAMLQQHYASVAVVAPPPVFSTLSVSNARAMWQQRRRHRAAGSRGGGGGSSVSNFRPPAPLSSEGSVYLTAADTHQGDGQMRRAADAVGSCEGDDDDDLPSAAFGSMRSGFSRQSSLRSSPYLTAETLSATHEQDIKQRRAKGGDTATLGREDRRSADARDAPLFSSPTTEREPLLLAHLRHIEEALQDVLSQLQARQRQHIPQLRLRESSSPVTEVQDSFDCAPSSTAITAFQATLPQSAMQSTTLHNATLLPPAFASSASEVATIATAAPPQHSGMGIHIVPAELPQLLSSRTASVMIPPSKQGMTNPLAMRASPPLSMHRSNPLWPTEDCYATEVRDPVRHNSTEVSDTLLPPSVPGRSASSSGDDVTVEDLLHKVLQRVNLLLDEVSHLSPPVTSYSSPLTPTTTNASQAS